jgi:hypothetical protein
MAKSALWTADQRTKYNARKRAKHRAKGPEYRRKERERMKKRRALLTENEKRIIREKNNRRKRYKSASKGLKQLSNGATYRELEAVQIHDLLMDETGTNYLAPLKLPDKCQGAISYPGNMTNEQEKQNWFTTNLQNSATFRTGCRHYLNGFLYDDLNISEWFVVEDGNCVINVELQKADGMVMEEKTRVKVFDSPDLLWDTQNSFYNFGKALSSCKSHVRANQNDMGTMHGFGQRIFNGELGCFAPLVCDMKTKNGKD